MGRTEDWWLYIKRIVRQYPALCREEQELHQPSLPVFDATRPGHSGSVSSPTETIALREPPENKRRRLNAVRYAIAATKRLPDSDARLAVVRMVYWENSHTITGAAMRIPCARNTASAWQARFIRTVAEYLKMP